MATTRTVPTPQGDARLVTSRAREPQLTLVLTHGAGGASLHTRSGITVSVPIAAATGPVVDTMGAGDATLATVIASIVRKGMPESTDGWRAYLTQAMKVAAATCTKAGGGLILPIESATDASGNSG